jgi:hypothetical protein
MIPFSRRRLRNINLRKATDDRGAMILSYATGFRNAVKVDERTMKMCTVNADLRSGILYARSV